MDSTDQVVTPQSTEEQPEVDTQVTEQQTDSVNENLIELEDGTQVSEEELKQGYLRQSDYTRKTQDLANQKKELEGEKTRFNRNTAPAEEVQLDPEVQKAAEVLKQAGFVTKDELALSAKKQADELRLLRIIDANPDLSSKEDAIRAIGKTDNRAWEDIIADYNFKDSNKILKARASRDVKGMPTPKAAPKEKSIKEMSSEEYADWKKANLKGQTY